MAAPKSSRASSQDEAIPASRERGSARRGCKASDNRWSKMADEGWSNLFASRCNCTPRRRTPWPDGEPPWTDRKTAWTNGEASLDQPAKPVWPFLPERDDECDGEECCRGQQCPANGPQTTSGWRTEGEGRGDGDARK